MRGLGSFGSRNGAEGKKDAEGLKSLRCVASIPIVSMWETHGWRRSDQDERPRALVALVHNREEMQEQT